MKITFYNSLTNSLEEFKTANKKPTYIIDSIADLINLLK